MSADNGPRTGNPDVGDALVAALGFEPTNGVATEAADIVLDGDPELVDWDDLETVNGGAHTLDTTADRFDGSRFDPAAPEVVDATMSPAKGQGKGPRTFTSGDTDTSGDTADHDGADHDGARSIDGYPHGRHVADGNSSGVKPLLSGDAPNGSLFDDTGPLPSSGRSPRTGSPVPKKTRSYDSEGTGSSTGDRGLPLAANNAEATVGDWDVPTAEVRLQADWNGPVALPTEAVRGVASADQPSEAVPHTGSAAGYPPPPTAEAANPAADRLDVYGAAAPTSDPDVAAGPSAPRLAEATVLDQPPAPLVAEAAPVAPPAQAPPSGERPQRAGVFNAGDLAARMPQFLDPALLKRSRRVRARKTRRVVRHVDPWSVLTFSVLFFLCLYAALLLSSVLVWNAAVAAGTLERVESFILELGDYDTYSIQGDVVFRAAMVIAGILTLASSVMMVLLTVVFNLISDLVGGIRMTVVEEETVRVRRRTEA